MSYNLNVPDTEGICFTPFFVSNINNLIFINIFCSEQKTVTDETLSHEEYEHFIDDINDSNPSEESSSVKIHINGVEDEEESNPIEAEDDVESSKVSRKSQSRKSPPNTTTISKTDSTEDLSKEEIKRLKELEKKSSKSQREKTQSTQKRRRARIRQGKIDKETLEDLKMQSQCKGIFLATISYI